MPRPAKSGSLAEAGATADTPTDALGEQAVKLSRAQWPAADASPHMVVYRRVAGIGLKLPAEVIPNEASAPLPGVPSVVARRLPRQWRQRMREHRRAWLISEAAGAGCLAMILALALFVSL